MGSAVNPLSFVALAFGLLFAWLTAVALRSGRVRVRSNRRTGEATRAEHPRRYWMLVSIYAGIWLYLWWLAWSIRLDH